MAILDTELREGLPVKAHKHVLSRIILTRDQCYSTNTSEIEGAQGVLHRESGLLLPNS